MPRLVKVFPSIMKFDRVFQAFAGMEDGAYDTIQNYLSLEPRLINDLTAAAREGNAKALEIAAHSLKGTVSNFHA